MRVENGGGGDLIIDEEGSHEASNVLQRRQELCLDRRERGGRQATHFSVPTNKISMMVRWVKKAAIIRDTVIIRTQNYGKSGTIRI